MEINKKNISKQFENLLDNLVDGETYDSLPPRGTQDLPFPSVSDQELRGTINQDIWGQDEEEPFDDPTISFRTKPVENFNKIEVNLPTEESLNNVNVLGIVGDNKRILTTSFHFILTRCSIVNFKYTIGFEKPYFYNRNYDTSAIMILDNNIFNSDYSIYTYNDIIDKFNSPLLDEFRKNSENKPFRFRYDYERLKKAPSSQSLGLAVKFQHTLELSCLKDIDFEPNGPTVCLKEGAIFSNSTSLTDIKNGLQKLLSWKGKPRIFVGVSTKVAESRVLLTTLSEHPHLIEQYFPGQHITPGLIQSFGSDSLLLKKILLPGFRTPMIEYIEKTREGAISEPGLEGLKPITCYYHKRSKPYNFIRIEMPKFMWETNKTLAEFAISIAVWQYELDGSTPLVLKAAADRSELSHERWIVEQQMKAAFERKNLELIEFIDIGK